MAPTRAAAGIVSTQAMSRLPAIPQRTADNRLVEPTPKIQAVMVWVVLMGAPMTEAQAMTAAADVSAANP